MHLVEDVRRVRLRIVEHFLPALQQAVRDVVFGQDRVPFRRGLLRQGFLNDVDELPVKLVLGDVIHRIPRVSDQIRAADQRHEAREEHVERRHRQLQEPLVLRQVGAVKRIIQRAVGDRVLLSQIRVLRGL